MRAIKSDPKDTNTLFKYGTFLDKHLDYSEAEEFYLRSLESDPYHSNCLCVYADFLACNKKEFDLAEEFYQCAIKADKSNPFAFNNYACLLLYRKKTEKVEFYFKKAIQIDEENPNILLNYSICLQELNKPEEASIWFDKYKEQKDLLRTISFSEIRDSMDL